MGLFVGAIGGLLMAVLIVILLCCFLKEMGVKAQWQEMAKTGILIAGVGIAELLVCGIYYTAKVNGTSLLDIQTVWAQLPLWDVALLPFSWYVTMFLGTVSIWNLYQIVNQCVGSERAKAALWLFFAVPGVYLIFLPVTISPVAVVITILLRVMVGAMGEKTREKMAAGIDFVCAKTGTTGYTIAVMLLAILNGVSVVKILGV